MRYLIPLIALLLVPMASAASYGLYLDIAPNGVADATLEIQEKEYPDSLDLMLPFYPSNAYAYQDAESIPLTLSPTPPYRLSFDLSQAHDHDPISLSFVTSDIVSLERQRLVLSTTLAVLPGDTLRVHATLPSGFVLSDMATPVLPEPSAIETDGKRITIIWTTEESSLSLLALFERGFSQQSSSLLGIGIAFIALLSLLIVLQYYRHQSRLQDTTSSNERKILHILKSHPQGIQQKQLVNKSGYSKGRLSKLLDRLEQKGFVIREKNVHGMKIKRKKQWL